MADNKNMELNDEMMAKAAGGKLEPGQEVMEITGIVLEDPFPNDSVYGGVWEECKAGGYQVYEIVGDGRIAVAGKHLPGYSIGDHVLVHQIRGFYGWEIEAAMFF
ncbi:MAG: hypothetical protein IJT16_06560 [Lachnospiraceae bacterium]|nr:hypothetical protein [Lachnospiraceae bacterium]